MEIKQKAIKVGKDYKEAIYTINYKDVPMDQVERTKHMTEKAKPYLMKEELE